MYQLPKYPYSYFSEVLGCVFPVGILKVSVFYTLCLLIDKKPCYNHVPATQQYSNPI